MCRAGAAHRRPQSAAAQPVEHWLRASSNAYQVHYEVHYELLPHYEAVSPQGLSVFSLCGSGGGDLIAGHLIVAHSAL